jgi:hypothetical protein
MLSSLAAAVRIAVGDRAVLRVRGEGTGHVGGVAVDGVFDVIVTVPIVEGHARLSCRGALPRRALRVPVVAIAACPAPPVVAPSVNAAVHVPAFTVALEVPP